MVNIDGKILNMLNEDEYYLFSFLLNYGMVSRPKNDVLMSKTGWALKKLQAVKKSLVDKGLLCINQRFVGSDGKRLGSNEYQITTNLASKYNGKKEAKKSAFEDVCMVEIELSQNEVCRIDIGQNDIGKIDIGIFDTDYKVLKVSIIESIKELLKREREKEKTPTLLISEIQDLKKQIELLSLENEKLKKEKSCEKKESGKHEFPKLNGTPAAVLTPPHKTDIDQAFYSAEDSANLKPYELAIQNYAFENWTETLKQAYDAFCEWEYTNSKHKFSGTQAKELIRVVEADKTTHGAERVEKCLRLCVLRRWAYDINYQINKEKREFEDSQPKQPKTFDKKPTLKDIPLLTGDLGHRNKWKNQ